MTVARVFHDRSAHPPDNAVNSPAGRTVAIQFVRSALESAQLHGLDAGAMLQEAGITPQLLTQGTARVTRQQANRLVQALWRATGDELAGIGPRPVPRGTFRMITLGVVHTPDLGEALRRFIEFSRLAIGFRELEMVQGPEHTRLAFDSRGYTGTDQLIVGIIGVIVHRFASWLIGRQIELSSLVLPGTAPSYAAEYLPAYGIAPHFGGSDAALSFLNHYLSAPVIRTEAELLELLRTSPNDLLFRHDYNPSISGQVRKIIEHSATGEVVSARDVAARLHISTQHLRRLLCAEGVTFRQIKEEILRDEAITSLTKGRESIEQLSERLGFSEPSAFRRAFRRWTGSSPGTYRPSQSGSG
ncbi:MAG TPA: AraC family transcriptional regulator [Mycobacterium sp.]|nr:AraC family transcriptional regulator [Mycobacterium sp.]